MLFQGKLNVGFSGANMLGVQFADAEFYYFLNNDCLLLNDCISILKKFMEAEPRAANCSGEMFIANGDYEYNFRYFPSLALKLLGSGLLRIMNPGAYPSRHKRFQVPTRVDLVNGSSMFIRATAFEEIGGFDTNYFLYCEEEDIALRFYRKGYGTFIIPEARYQHFVSKSTTSNNQISLPYLKEYYISFFYYFRKNYNYFYAGLMRLYFVIKIGVKFYKTLDYLRLALFIAGGCHMKHSLRFTQKITNH